MKKILVPVDFTPASLTASKYAASLAKLWSAELYLLHAFQEPVPLEPSPSVWMVTDNSIQKQSEKRVKEEVRSLSKTFSVPVFGEALLGSKGGAIHDYANIIKADLIVMGRKSGKRKPLSGSTIFKAIRKTNLPVLVVPETVYYVPIHFITLALDFEPLKNTGCFDLLFNLVEKSKATLRVLHVEKKGVKVKTVEGEQKARISRAFSNISFWYDEIEEDDIDLGIEQFIKEHPTDLLVMVAHHHSIFERLFGTIHTSSVSYQVNIPLLVLPDK